MRIRGFRSLKIWRRGERYWKKCLMIPHKSICFQIWLWKSIFQIYLSVYGFKEPTISDSPKVFVTKVCLVQIYWIRIFRINILWQALLDDIFMCTKVWELCHRVPCFLIFSSIFTSPGSLLEKLSYAYHFQKLFNPISTTIPWSR